MYLPGKPRMIDDTDRQILALLQENARIANAEIARRVGMAASAIHERVRKLEERGVIRGYEARLDPVRLGFSLLAFVFVRADEGVGATETEARLATVPEVQEVHHVAGEDCFLVKVRVPNTGSLSGLLRERIGEIPTVTSTRTTVVLETTKETGRLPLGAATEVKEEKKEAAPARAGADRDGGEP